MRGACAARKPLFFYRNEWLDGLCLPRGNNQSLADAQGAGVREVVSLGDGFVGNMVALCNAI